MLLHINSHNLIQTLTVCMQAGTGNAMLIRYRWMDGRTDRRPDAQTDDTCQSNITLELFLIISYDTAVQFIYSYDTVQFVSN